MPQVTLSVPHQKLPILKDVLDALGIDNLKVKDFAPAENIGMQYNFKESVNNIFRKYFSWEYYSNELEFE